MRKKRAVRAICAFMSLIFVLMVFSDYLIQNTIMAHASEDILASDEVANVKTETASDSFSWGNAKKECTITTAILGYTDTDNIVSIPRKCTMIYKEAFRANKRKNNADITTLKFKEEGECTEIGDYAFYGANDFQPSRSSLLTTVDLSNSKVSTIGNYAFSHCDSLKSITWPTAGTIKVIGESCFEYDNALSAVNLPATVGSIGDYAFAHNNMLKSVVSYGTVGEYAYAYNPALDNAVINGNIGMGGFYGDRLLRSVKINAQYIGEKAFYENESLESVDFSQSTALKTIGKQAFYGCGLNGVIIPGTVTLIDESAFASSKLSDVTFINQSDIKIGKRAFYNNNLKSASVPDSCVAIGEEAFAENPLTIVNIGNKLDIIEKGAYSNKETLTTVNVNGIPANVSEEGVFQNSILENINFSPNVTKIANNLFCYSHFNNVTRLVIPDNVQVIGKNAFKGVTGLGCIFLPDNISEIQEGAFELDNQDFYILIKDGAESHKALEEYNNKNEEGKKIVIKILLEDGKIVDDGYKDKEDEDEGNITDPDIDENDQRPEPGNKEDNSFLENYDKVDPSKPVFNIVIKYYKDALDISETIRPKKKSYKIQDGVTIVEEQFYKKTDGTKTNITYTLKPVGNNEILNVYVDSVDQGSVSSVTFFDDYNHEIIINMKDKKQIFQPIADDKENIVDIFYYPECVNVSGPDSVHTFNKIGEYAYKRYFFDNDENHDFYFESKNGVNIKDVVVDGVSKGSLTKYSVSGNGHHNIIIQSEGKQLIPLDVTADDKDVPVEPSNREYDDDGNLIDKKKPMHSIVYNLAGGTNSPYNFGYYYEGSVFYFRNPTKPGCVFEGWYSGNTKVVSTKGCTTNLKLTAKWKNVDYTITYELNGGHFKKPSKVVTTYNILKTVKLQKPVKEGYTFIGWFYGDAKIKKLKKGDSIRGTITLVAKWTPNVYTIRYSSNKGSGKMTKTTNCIYDKAVKLPMCTMTRAGKTFAGWNTKKNGTGTAYADGAEVISLKKKGKITLYAQWK